MTLDRHSLALAMGFATFVAVTGVVPKLTAEKPRTVQFGVRTVPIDANGVTRINAMLRTPGVSASASTVVTDSISLAKLVATAHGEDEALQRAHQALIRQDYRRAEVFVDLLVAQLEKEAQAIPVGSEKDLARLTRTRNQALLLKSNVLMQTGAPAEAVEVLNSLSPDTPVDDFITYLQAENHVAMGEHRLAADLFGRVTKIEESPLLHRAIARRAHALFNAGDFEAAQKAFDQVIDSYPLYPRRWLALYERAVALDELGKDQSAADAYHDTWFEFPFKKVGQDARARLAELEKAAVVPSDLPSARDRYNRYRELRINKHWDLARELFSELQSDYATESGHSEFEHDIEFQLALNAYGQREFTEAKERLLTLVAAYEAGERRGISRYLLYKYLSRTENRLGNEKAALAALDKMSEGYGSRSRMRARAEFFEDNGQYDKALKLHSQLYSAYKKRGWHYTWLLYKTGKFEAAYDNLSDLASRSYGRNRAKYLYWAGRTLERAGKDDEAREIFVDIAESDTLGYYGLQSRNRLMDLEQRRSVAGQLVASAEGIANSADQVLDALEEAEFKAAADAFAYPLDDPRTRQRHALWGSQTLPQNWTSGEACDGKPKSPKGFCQIAPTTVNTTSTGSKTTLVTSVQVDDDSTVIDDDTEPPTELDARATRDARIPTRKVRFDESQAPRIDYSTMGRIYWEGRMGSGVAFARARDGELVGPVPTELSAYDEPDYRGGLERAAREYGDLFPELEQSYWLYIAGFEKGARWAARDVAIEYRELSRRWKPRRKPHELGSKRWEYHIDNRRRGRSAFWGLESDELRFPVPSDARGQKEMLARQQRIHDERRQIRPILVEALKEVGDHYTVRKLTLAQKGWFREDPRGPARPLWMQAYPRAFPRLVVSNAQRYGVNPYLLWALMTVESSYNPDSLSTADALGLLQVIPKTGLKTAILLGDEQFGPFDLLEEEVAIQHGAFYISKLIRKFRGQELLAFAGYNGGPHRVGDWIEDRGHTMPLDEFVEEIPFNQARGYTKKVFRFLSLYLQIYEGRNGLYVGQNLRTDYRPEPNF